MLYYLNNFIKVDCIDKYDFTHLFKGFKWTNLFKLETFLHLKFIKKEIDFRMINTFLLLEYFVGIKPFIKKISFIFIKKKRSYCTEVLYSCSIKKETKVLLFLIYYNLYFITYYETYITKQLKKVTNFFMQKELSFFSSLNKLFLCNKTYRKKDEIVCSATIENKTLSLEKTFFSFILAI